MGAAPIEHGEGGIGAAAAGMGPGAQDNGGHNRAHASPAEQVGSPGPDQGRDGAGVVSDLGVQELDAAGQSAQADRSGGSLDIPGGLLTEPPTGGDQARRGQARQPPTEAVGAATTRAWSWRWASVAAWTAERRAASRTDNAAR